MWQMGPSKLNRNRRQGWLIWPLSGNAHEGRDRPCKSFSNVLVWVAQVAQQGVAASFNFFKIRIDLSAPI